MITYVDFNNVYQRTDIRPSPDHRSLARELVRDLKLDSEANVESFLLILSWPTKLSYLRIHARHGRPTAVAFKEDRKELRELFKKYGV
ncbi:MAG: hypothetical protein NTY19_26020, partial [Planctomycetota bacterium]|nr:hypothetical protein [Planctomycetota bacterium]